MKVKALIKAIHKSNDFKFSDKYTDDDTIMIDGCFTPYSKAREDKRRVDSFTVDICNNGTKELRINTVYIKESIVHAISDEKSKKDKNIKKKIRKDEIRCQKLEKKLMKTKKKMETRKKSSNQESTQQ